MSNYDIIPTFHGLTIHYHRTPEGIKELMCSLGPVNKQPGEAASGPWHGSHNEAANLGPLLDAQSEGLAELRDHDIGHDEVYQVWCLTEEGRKRYRPQCDR